MAVIVLFKQRGSRKQLLLYVWRKHDRSLGFSTTHLSAHVAGCLPFLATPLFLCRFHEGWAKVEGMRKIKSRFIFEAFILPVKLLIHIYIILLIIFSNSFLYI